MLFVYQQNGANSVAQPFDALTMTPGVERGKHRRMAWGVQRGRRRPQTPMGGKGKTIEGEGVKPRLVKRQGGTT
jgi:hypothetical protein